MTVLTSAPRVTSVYLRGLDTVNLPFTPYVLDPGLYGELDATLSEIIRLDQEDKYYVKSITGLEPPDRSVAIARTASGGKYQGVTTEDRELVVLIGLNPDWDAGETPKLLRDNLYTMMFTGYDPRIDVVLAGAGLPIAHEFGYVSKFEASIFDANPVVQLTITMLNPTFQSYSKTSYAKADLSETDPNVYNYGTAETGFQFAVKFAATRNGWWIKQADNPSVGMTFDMTFHTDDILAVSTIPGSRYVHWNKKRGKVTNKLGILTGDSEWMQLHPGNNHFLVPKKTSSWDWKGADAFVFTAQYAGV